MAEESTGAPLRVAIFGGSVAFLCSFLSREKLAAELAALPEFRERTVAVESYALGGYKQPQQLQALTYLLAQGERPDLVVNLDGFNELAIPYAHNVPQGVAAAYPFNWSTKVRDLPDPVLDRLRGRLESLRESRRRRARLFSQPALSHSFAWNLLWEAQDSSLAADASAVEVRALEYKPPIRSYLTQGPGSSYADDAELFTDLAAIWRRSSLQMHRLSMANGIRYYHFLQPNQYVPGAKTLSEEERRTAFDAASPYREPVAEGYPYLQEAGRELAAAGVPFADLVDLFRNDPDTIYFDTCCHLNPRGCDLVVERVVEAIRRDISASADAGH